MKAPSHTTVVAYLALVLALGGTAEAASGGGFLLGRGNSATTTTSLSDSHGVPLSLAAKNGQPALRVNTTAKVPHLNSDLLDGLDSLQLQRATTASCAGGTGVKTVASDGTTACTAYQLVSTPFSDASFLGADAVCPTGTSVISGGYRMDWSAGVAASQLVDTSRPGTLFGGVGWYIHTSRVSNDPDAPAGSVGGTVYAICVG